jgi:hypothetical protein
MSAARLAAMAAGVLVLAGGATYAVTALRPPPVPVTPAPRPLATSTPSAVARGPLPELKPDSGPALIRPAGVYFSADGTNVVQNIRWREWTDTIAVGTGTHYVDNCRPNCAQGTTTSVPETLTLSQPQGGYFTLIVGSYDGNVTEYHSGKDLQWPLDLSASSN